MPQHASVQDYPPRKAELYPQILNKKPFKPPAFVRQEASLTETCPKDEQKGDPRPNVSEKAGHDGALLPN